MKEQKMAIIQLEIRGQGHVLVVTINKKVKRMIIKMMKIIRKGVYMKLYIEKDYKKLNCSRKFVNKESKSCFKKKLKVAFLVLSFKNLLYLISKLVQVIYYNLILLVIVNLHWIKVLSLAN